MANRFYLSFICILFLSRTLAQQEAEYTRVIQTIPPSPNAASLGQFGNYLLDNFTGVPAINIPLLDIPVRNFHLPITLNYNAGGIKVEDIGSWVGLGWSLNYGGSLTRTVVDVPDDYQYGGSFGTGVLHENWYQPGYNPPDGAPITETLDPFGATPPLTMIGQLESLRRGTTDTEPDIFFYNINGVSGKFFFDTGMVVSKSRVVKTPYRDVDIDLNCFTSATTDDTGGPGTINQFILTDENGNKFYYDIPEMTTTTDLGGAFMCQGCSAIESPGSADLTGGTYHGGRSFRSAWYLDKIVTAAGDEIDYTYANESYSYEANTTQLAKAAASSMSMTDVQGCAFNLPPGGGGFSVADDETEIQITGKRLSTITGPNFKVEFDANHNRQDITGAQALTNIKYYTETNGTYTLVKQFELTYHYMADLSVPQATTEFLVGGDSRMHLLLDTVYQSDQNGQNISNYNLQYNSAVPLPDRLSNYKDFWGYFCNYHCTTAFPKLYVYPDYYFNPDVDTAYYPKYSVFPKHNYTGRTFILPGANRNTDPVAILSGTLNQITFPTGGYTQFTFEPHTFNYDGANFQGGGLRLKQSISYDGLNHANDIIRNYTYTNTGGPTKDSTSGILFNLPIFAYGENANRDSQDGTDVGPLSVDDTNYYKVNVVRSDVSQTTLGGFDGINVGYREITETQPGNGSIVRRYAIPGYFGQISDYTNDGGCDVNHAGFCDGYFQAPTPQYYNPWVPCYTNGSTPVPTSLQLNLEGIETYTPYTFPFAPMPNYDWNRGEVMQESYYNNSGQLQKNTTYQYTLFSPGNTGPRLVTSLKKGRLLNYALMTVMGFNPCGYTDGVARYDVIVPYFLIGQTAKVPSRVQTTDYDNNGNALTTTKTYTYSYNSLLPSSISTNRSDGSTTIKNDTYVTDLSLSQSSSLSAYLGFQNLLNEHILYHPVEEYQQKKNTDNSIVTTEGSFIKFRTDFGMPDTAYSLYTSQPLTNFTPVIVTPLAVAKDSRYQAVVTYDAYDGRQNLLQQTKVNDMSRSYIWDYNGMYPIAEVFNAPVSGIAYTSFEADGTGNWAIGSTIRTAGSAVTGNQSYNLTNQPIIYPGPLQTASTYIVSYWSQSGPQVVNGSGPSATGLTTNSGWTYYEHQITGATGISITPGTAGGTIDELRLYPKGAVMTTYTYTPLEGMTSSCDASGKITYYQYDTFGRLKLIEDPYGNILKRYSYQYQTTNN